MTHLAGRRPAVAEPIHSALFAAFAIASTSSAVMSPSTTESSRSATAEPPEAIVLTLLLAPLRERLATVLLGGQVHLSGEAGRSHREGQRVDRDIPTLERAAVFQQVERLPRRHAVGRHGVDHVAALLAALQLSQAAPPSRR